MLTSMNFLIPSSMSAMAIIAFILHLGSSFQKPFLAPFPGVFDRILNSKLPESALLSTNSGLSSLTFCQLQCSVPRAWCSQGRVSRELPGSCWYMMLWSWNFLAV